MPILTSILNPIEGRAHPSTLPKWLSTMLGVGYETDAGITVTEETALQYTAVFSAIRILSEGVSMLPLKIYERLERGKRTATDHPLYTLLHSDPNPEMTSMEFRDTVTGHLVGWGNAYVNIVYDVAGRVKELWPLLPNKMRVKRENGILRYYYRLPSNVVTVVAAEEILHLRGLGFNGIVGYSPIGMARQAIGLGLAAERFGARFFGNGARPGIVMEHPNVLSDEAAKHLRESWEARHEGIENSHRVAILEEGMKIHEIGIPPEDAQFLETRKFQVNEIARLFRIPPHMLQDLERATFSNIEQMSIDFVTHSLGPWLVRWEQRLNKSLLTKDERRRYFVEHLVAGLLRGDITSRYNAYSVGRQWGWLSANDVRELENMNPVDGGDIYMMPMNMVPADGVLPTPPTQTGEGDTANRDFLGGMRRLEYAGREPRGRERRTAASRHRLAGTYRPTLEDVAQRIINREVNDVRNAARKHLDERGLLEFNEWLRTFYDEHFSFVVRYLKPVMGTYAELVVKEVEEEIGDEVDKAEVDVFVNDYLTSRAGVWVAQHRTRIMEAAREGDEPLAAVEVELDEMKEKSASHWAADQANRLNNAIALTAYVLLGVSRKTWVAFGDNCPYCNSLNGATVEITKYFLAAGEELDAGDEDTFTSRSNIGHPPLHNGCDCMIIAA